ncbi:MAG: Abi family protein [Clostridia bacterium]
MTYDEQIQRLISDGIIINDISFATNKLIREGYFNLISGYSFIFKDKNGIILKNTSFEDILCVYEFDKNLKNIIYEYASTAEKNIKARLGYVFGTLYGDDETLYLNENNFNTIPANENYIRSIIYTIKDVINDALDIKSKRYRQYIEYSKTKYGLIPFWILVRTLTFGTISKFYSLMKKSDRTEIAKSFGMDEANFGLMMEMLVFFRNTVAHGERIFNAKVPTKRLSSHLTIYKSMQIKTTVFNEPLSGKCDFLALLIILKYLLEKSEFTNLMRSLLPLLSDIDNCLPFNISKRIKKEMGLISGDWKNLHNLKLIPICETSISIDNYHNHISN